MLPAWFSTALGGKVERESLPEDWGRTPKRAPPTTSNIFREPWRSWGSAKSWPESLTFKVNLVLEELGLNILTHGSKGQERRPEIEIVLTSEEDALTIEVVDDGQPFDPLEDAPNPSVDSGIEERNIGGLGIHLVRTMMDDLHYQRDDGKNRLTLVARRE